jgi:hypothetical protein
MVLSHTAPKQPTCGLVLAKLSRPTCEGNLNAPTRKPTRPQGRTRQMEIAGGHHCPSNGLRRGQAPTAAPAGARPWSYVAGDGLVSARLGRLHTCARVQACPCESPATEAGRQRAPSPSPRTWSETNHPVDVPAIARAHRMAAEAPGAVRLRSRQKWPLWVRTAAATYPRTHPSNPR